MLWTFSFSWVIQDLNGCANSNLPLYPLCLRHRIFLATSAYLLLPNKLDFSIFHQNILDFRKIHTKKVLLCDILHLFPLPKIPLLPQIGTFFFFFFNVQTAVRICFNSLLLTLWHREYSKWLEILNSPQFNKKITIY